MRIIVFAASVLLVVNDGMILLIYEDLAACVCRKIGTSNRQHYICAIEVDRSC